MTTHSPQLLIMNIFQYISDATAFIIDNNDLDYKGIIQISSEDTEIRINENNLKSDFISISTKSQNGLYEFKENTFSSPVFLDVDPFSAGNKVDWKQFTKGILSDNAYRDYTVSVAKNRSARLMENEQRNQLIKKYIDSVRYYDEKSFDAEVSLKSLFYSHFKNIHNTKLANKVYIELKDFETQRLQIEYEQKPSFDRYFKWKVNQFLKLFSDYGTEPSKAVTFSFYVIICFAFIYLFFPNHWDSHSKNRLLDRFKFFLKYIDKKSGIHEVYLEEQQQDLLVYEDFKALLNEKGGRVPQFFIKVGLPLYKWAVSGTIFSAALLKRIDIIKGTWYELSPAKRLGKSILLIGAFTVAILYDISIKILNALMLSINTFTTLGFGEIPIKGLPRYLAIIQGFIGWFMLTIFSVSLISQLLN